MRRVQVRVGSVQDIRPLDDGYSWRKYGQKDILGSKYPRAYFRCTYRHSRGCLATKLVQRMDIDPLLFDVVYYGEHTCGQNAHSVIHLGDSISTGSKEPPATSESQITYGEISGSTAGIRFMSPAMSSSQVNSSPATSESQVTYEEISGSVTGVRFMSPATSGGQATWEEARGSTSRVGFMSPATANSYKVASGSGSTTGSRLVSPAMSASQVTYEVVSGSTAGSWSAPDEADSTMDDLLDLNSPVDDYAEEIYLNPVHKDLDSGLRAPPSSPKSLS